MSRFTKITASIGPSSENESVLEQMIKSGVNVCRINFSHDAPEIQSNKIDAVRKVSEKLKIPVGILIDLQGPKHRIGNFQNGEKYKINSGQTFIFDSDPTPGNSGRVCLPHPDVLASLKVGDRILLDDGKIEMQVINVATDAVQAKVIRGTEIWSRRGFNVPDTNLNSPILTDKDKKDLECALKKHPDWVAISFVQGPEDIAAVRDFITERVSEPIKIMAKIERKNAVENFSEIAMAADGIMIARGDLAIELPFEQVPAISRYIICECGRLNKPVMIATQMLGSMVNSEFPTRAEISDVANAAYLHADSTMTSEETTVGSNPVAVIETMAKILEYSDADAMSKSYDVLNIENTSKNDWSRSVVSMAVLNRVGAIIVFARDIDYVTQISCRRSNIPIVAICDSKLVANQLCLLRGVFSFYTPDLFAQRDINTIINIANIKTQKVVIVDGDDVSLRDLDEDNFSI